MVDWGAILLIVVPLGIVLLVALVIAYILYEYS